MTRATLTAEHLLSGGEARHEVEIPEAVLRPDLVSAGGPNAAEGDSGDGLDKGSDSSDISGAGPSTVILRPLRLVDLQSIDRAGQDSPSLHSVLMVQRALVAPSLTIDQVSRLHSGLVQFLLQQVHRLSGLEMDEDELQTMVRQPLARACFVLAREFGWTPQECSELTLGQILLYLEMIGKGEKPEAG